MKHLPTPCPWHRPDRLGDWPRHPGLEAHHLVNDNDGWRTRTPGLDPTACIRCGLCFLYCPEGAIAKTPEGLPTIAAQWCKGCGLCAAECPKDALTMEDRHRG